jgi:hypothetical protein
MSGRTSRASKNAPSTSASTTFFQSASDVFSRERSRKSPPALATAMSTPPNARSAWRTRRTTSASLRVSARTATAQPREPSRSASATARRAAASPRRYVP